MLQQTDKDCSFASALWLFTPMWNVFSLMQPQTWNKDASFWLNQFLVY